MTSWAGLLQSSVLAGALLAAAASPSAARTEEPDWNPESSERLVKLPASYLKKSLDHDFAESELGQALIGVEEEAGFKTQTLHDVRSAIERADGEVRTELRHQFLVEKRSFIELMSRKNSLKRKHLKTKTRLLEDMLNRMTGQDAAASPARLELIEWQNAARERLDSSLAKVDLKIFDATTGPESKYTQKYAKNMAAIERLVSRIQSHPIAELTDGLALTKQDFLRHMLADAQAGLSILDQEETILGYMAKLVALDALALSEEDLDAELADSDVPPASSPAAAVDFFMTN